MMKIPERPIMGVGNEISLSTLEYGKNLKMGNYNTLKGNITVGNNVEICHYVLLKDGTIIGDDCYIDSYVLTSGQCTIGNNVKIRYQSIIARNVEVHDNVFFCAGVKTAYLDHLAKATHEPLIIEDGCFLGDNCVIMGGVKVAKNCIIGANALVTRNTEPNGVYVGCPAKRIREVGEDEIWYLN